MIPASYLFKDTYRRHWEEPDAPVVVERHHSFFHGLMTPLSGAIDAIFTRHSGKARIPHGGHAYE